MRLFRILSLLLVVVAPAAFADSPVEVHRNVYERPISMPVLNTVLLLLHASDAASTPTTKRNRSTSTSIASQR